MCSLLQNEPHYGFDDYDIRLMIQDRGVNDNKLADALVALHGKMCAECIGAGGGKLFSVSHLLRAADLFARWMKRGISASPALHETAFDVYVRDVHDYCISQVRYCQTFYCLYDYSISKMRCSQDVSWLFTVIALAVVLSVYCFTLNLLRLYYAECVI
jgi:hypothetical protein